MRNKQNIEIEKEIKPSKTQRKQAMHALQKMGEQLVALNHQQLEKLDLPQTLLDAILHARQINKFGARQRQMQYIGKLMRTIEVASIQEKLDIWKQASLNQSVEMHQIERWRERILSDAQAITEFAGTYPNADIQQIRLLVRNINKEREFNKPPKSYRLLFKALQNARKESTKNTD